jgi:phage gp45-like
MNPLDLVLRALRPIARRVDNMIARATVKKSDDAKKIQELQIGLLAGEVRDEVERFQNYGFTAVPLEGAEAAVIFVGGRRDHGLAIAVDDRRYRIKSLESGEVCVYNHTGAKIVFKANGDVEVTPKSGQKLKIASDVEVTGTLTASVDVVGNGISLHGHKHAVAGTVAAAPGAVVFLGTPPGFTGGPS